MKTLRHNPWALPPSEERIMDVMCKVGCHKLAAESLGLSTRTTQVQVRSAKKRMGQRQTVLALINWAVWRKTSTSTTGKDAP